MPKSKILSLLLIISFTSYGQVAFQGNDTTKVVDCNPTEIKIKGKVGKILIQVGDQPTDTINCIGEESFRILYENDDSIATLIESGLLNAKYLLKVGVYQYQVDSSLFFTSNDELVKLTEINKPTKVWNGHVFVLTSVEIYNKRTQSERYYKVFCERCFYSLKVKNNSGNLTMSNDVFFRNSVIKCFTQLYCEY
ncbi:MAG: hypothetical protein Q8M15_11910 [Bacteroidota bacterium]|nr:hypothetical protein [Bacteroidota bacterium]